MPEPELVPGLVPEPGPEPEPELEAVAEVELGIGQEFAALEADFDQVVTELAEQEWS